MRRTTRHEWLSAAALLLHARAQTHVKTRHRSLDLSFSQITLNPADEYLARANADLEWSYADAEQKLNYEPYIESFITFDLDHSWFKYLEDYLSSATLKLYSFGSLSQKVDFDILTDDDDDSWSVDSDASCKDSCWIELDVTEGLLWSIEEQPGLKEVTVRISTDESIEGAFASSFTDDYSPQLIIDFDRNENLAEVQLELLQIRQEKLAKKREKRGKKNEKKGKEDEQTAVMQVNSAGVNKPKKKPGKKRPGNKKKPGNKKPAAIKSNANKKPAATKPNANKKPAANKPDANKKPRPNKYAQGNSRPKPTNINNKPKPKPQNEAKPDDIGKHGPISQESGKISNTAAAKEALKIIFAKSSTVDNKLFLYESPADGWIPSTIYKSDGLLKGLEVMNGKGVNGMYFYLGGDSSNGHKYGLVNVAAFLAQSMKETIKYDACDENSWDLVDGKYPLSNACGQLGQSYQDYHCPDHERHMECPVDPKMEITAKTHAKWFGAPAPLFCRPKKDKNDFTGYWNYGFFCNVPWVDPPIRCEDYEGQKAGKFENDEPFANRNGRTDVEGCCWWGRGVIQTTGVCNFGKLNYWLGARAAKEGRDAPYGQYDFCKDPEVICASEENKELKWIAGMFYWMESVQQYDSDGWNYMTELSAFVDGGYKDPGFINAVSGIVNRGCHNPPCGTGAVDGGPERSNNFQQALAAFGLIKLPKLPGGGSSGVAKGSPQTVCGTDWLAASKCEKSMKECASSLDCPSGQFCWAGVVC